MRAFCKLTALAALLGAGLLGAACSSGQAQAPEAKPDAGVAPIADAAPPALPTASLDSKDSKLVAKTLVQVSALRGVQAQRPVPGVKLERGDLVAHVKEKALREVPPDALRREGAILQLLGFAPPTFDYLSETMRLLDAQLQGFYEPKNGTMYLAADLQGAEAQATLAHELVHALQDQTWDLKSRSLYKPGKSDETLALAALAEGDATSLMFDFMMKPSKTALDLPEKMLTELMKQGLDVGDIATVPHILRTTLIAPYVEGLAFVNALRRKGGWDAVNGAWKRVPVTSEQVLHLDKWESSEPPLEIATPTAASLGEGWKKDDEDEFGELGYVLTFGEWTTDEEARQIAAGWGGDRSAVFSHDKQLAFAVHERYDAPREPKARPEAQVERAAAKLFPAMTKKLGKPAASDASFVCWERPETGPLLVARKDRDLVILAGPTTIEGTGAASKWTSASTCAVAKKWADEVLAQK